MPETLPPRPATPPRMAPPPRACDCHAHVFGPPDRFPPAPNARYAPPHAYAEDFIAMLDQLGIAYGVAVQPAPYVDDNAALLDALARYPDRLRGVALAPVTVSDDKLAQFARSGIRGLRFSHFPDDSSRKVGVFGLQDLAQMAPRLREQGLHAQLWLPCAEFVAHAPALLKLGVPLVLDHLTKVDPQRGVDDAAFQTLLSILRNEDIWLKLTPHRPSAEFPDYADIRPFHEAALAARPERLVWGTDWPFTQMGDLTPDPGHLLDLFMDWTTDAALRQAILVDNPARLYGFSPGQ